MGRLTVGGDAAPVFFNHGGELFVWTEVLVVQLVAPGVEESAHVVRVGVVPKLLELLAQKIGDVQTRVGLQKAFKVLAPVVGQVFSA